MAGLSVNLSAMTDTEVIAMRDKIEKIYRKEKDKLTGKRARFVGKLRFFIYRKYKKIDKKYISQLPEGTFFSFIKKLYHSAHNYCQVILDNLWLYLLDIK